MNNEALSCQAKKRETRFQFLVGYEPKRRLHGALKAMSENASEKTPESGGPRAIEDIRPEHGALVRPQGQPVALGPSVQVNPFWSESAREEAILRACRPSHLPSEVPEPVQHVAAPVVSPPRESQEAVRMMMQGLLQENAKLWSEREMFASGHGNWGQAHGQFGFQQPHMGSLLGEQQGPMRNPLGPMFEAVKSMWGPMFQQQDRGLLGPLSMPGDRNGVFPPSRTESGWLGSQMHLPRGNLMELFNMVSGGGFSGSMISPGAFDRGGMAGVQGSAGFVAEGSGRAVADQVSGRSSQAQMETTQLRPEPQGCASQPAGDPAGGLGGQPGGSEAGGSAQGGANGQAGDQSGRGDSGQPSGSGVNQPGGAPFPHGDGPGGFPGGGFPGGFPFGGGGPGGFPGGRGGPGDFPGGGLPGGFPGGGPGGPPGGGGAGGLPMGQIPAWIGGLMAQQESVRAVDLPALPELSESEVGPLLAGDWITTIGPFLRDMSSSSSFWWDEVLRVAGALYRVWLGSEPMERLRLNPVSPPAFQVAPWLRIEQRGSVALLKALPESLRSELVAQREVSSIGIMFKILRVYQPGGLGERTTLLKQLVDQKVPAPLSEWMVALRAWRRWLTRVQELGIQPPDPVLLLATLDRFAAGLGKHSPQVAFRLQVTRAALRVDTAPTEQGIHQFSESLLAEGEAVFHGGSWLPLKESVKVRALDGDAQVHKDDHPKRDAKDKSKEAADGKDFKENKDGKGGKPEPKNTKGDGKPGPGEKPVCRYFLSDSGCKKGQKCSFPHEWKGVSKQGRCWNCGSSQHMKSECPVKEAPRVKKETTEDLKVKEAASKSGEQGSSSSAGAGTFLPPSDLDPPPAEALVKEAVQLLKSLRPAVRAVTVCAVNRGKGFNRALLDGGATHILRPAKSKVEFDKAVPIQVELAAGVTTLRQIQETGTLVTDFDTQMIVPLGKVVKLGYKVTWEGEEFEMVDSSGVRVEVLLEAGCPTVDLKTAQRMIQELEDQEREMVRRVNALRAGDPGDLSPSIWRWLRDLRQLWPEVPDELLARVVPSGRWSGEQVPLNRHQRKRLFSSKSVIVHLFSGPDQAWWRKRLETSSRSVLCIDKLVDPSQDLLSDQLTSFLAELCEKGTVDALLGGAACRTVSKLRFRQPGPPPLRARSGPQRFALDSLTDTLRELAWNDAVLWMRQLWLYSLASSARPREVLFMKEHPRDPEEYKSENDPVEYPSFFAWPEWQTFIKKFGMREVRLDLGALGHPRRKPTTLGTNIRYLHQLEGLTDHRRPGDLPAVTSSLGEKTAESRSWAAWPLDFKIEITKGILLQIGQVEDEELKDVDHKVAKLTSEQWKQHVANDHLPYSRECPVCLQGSGKNRPHRKVQRPDALTLSVDICGPFRPGVDRRKKAKYFMVGVFSIPVKKVDGKVTPLPLGLEEAKGVPVEDEEPKPEELVPVLEEVEPEVHEERAEDVKAMEEWEKLEVEAEDIEIQNYTMVETLESRQVAEVKMCLARMIARLKYLGLDVRRVHSDAAGEMRGTKKWCQDRGLYRTFTCGSDWKANGRAEAEIGVIRRAINTLIRSSGDGEDYWPLMAKHVGERRGRQQLASLGFVTPQLLPWGQRVMITTKGWDDFQGHWRARKKPGLVRGPDPDMSLTSGGHLVEVENGNFIRTDDMVPVGGFEIKDVVELAVRDQPADLLDKTVQPRRRLTEKTSLSKIGGAEIQCRLLRGQTWANEEFKRLEAQMTDEGSVELVANMDSENHLMERFLQESEAVVKRLEVESLVSEAEGEEIFLQTRTIGLNEVRKNLPLWIPPLKEEISNFDSNQAIHRVSEKEALGLVREAEEKGQRAEIIPGMGVFTRKAGGGRRRARIVCCGNYMESRSGEEVYATGADTTQLRAMLRVASLHDWHCLSLDVKSAFLLAPKAQGDLVIVKPPKILVDAELAKSDEHWVITSAMYGLVTSPKDWSVYRDAELQKMEGVITMNDQEEDSNDKRFGFRPLKDANLWAIQEVTSTPASSTREWGEVLGYMIVYVDDILMVGPRPVTDVASKTIHSLYGQPQIQSMQKLAELPCVFWESRFKDWLQEATICTREAMSGRCWIVMMEERLHLSSRFRRGRRRKHRRCIV